MKQYWIEGVRVKFIAGTNDKPEIMFRLPVCAASDAVAQELATLLGPVLAPGNGHATDLRISQELVPVEYLPAIGSGPVSVG
jgi:hypothetical protein